MKKLYLIRHAKASWDNPEQSDFERPLTPQGEIDANAMAVQLKAQNLKPDLIISSNAVRALSTAKILAEELKFPVAHIVSDPHIYSGGVEELVTLVKAISTKLNTVFIVGHNPSLTLLAHYLCEGTKVTITTCGVLGIEFAMKKWEEAVETEGKFITYFHPHHHEHHEHYEPYEGS